MNNNKKLSIRKSYTKTKQYTRIKQNTKALVLFSGGLDSRLVIKLLQQQGITPLALFFKLPFGGGCCNDWMCSFQFSQIQGVRLEIVDCTKGKNLKEYLDLIKTPKFGRGNAFNPCIDCHLFMLKRAKSISKKLGCDFIATGEVLGERPMSQHKQALMLIEKQAGLEGKVLRPLSAQLLDETQAEKQGLVDRNKLFDIQGKNRTSQIKLAKKFKINYPNPAGGCQLCEKTYAIKLKDLLAHKQIKEINIEEIKLLKGFRHFRSKNKEKGKIILGKEHKENLALESANKKLCWNIIIPSIPGPTAIYENIDDKMYVEELIEGYSKKK